MHFELKGVHYHVSDNTTDYIEKKMLRLESVKDKMETLHLTITKEKNQFKVEANFHMHWGAPSHIRVDNHELWPAIDLLFDKLIVKVKKEKEKIIEHH
jgi:putative sigma-54 modulation protein